MATYIVNVITPASLYNLVWAYPLFYLALTVSVCAYRLSPFHPLAKYPGPVMLKVTKLWGAWEGYQGKTHLYVKGLHDRYGPIVRIGEEFSMFFWHKQTKAHTVLGPNELSTTVKGLIPQILGNQGMPKGPRKFFAPSLLYCISYILTLPLRMGWAQIWKCGKLQGLRYFDWSPRFCPSCWIARALEQGIHCRTDESLWRTSDSTGFWIEWPTEKGMQ